MGMTQDLPAHGMIVCLETDSAQVDVQRNDLSNRLYGVHVSHFTTISNGVKAFFRWHYSPQDEGL